MAAEIKVIVLKREPTAYADGSVPGTLTVGDREFPTIERGGGYTALKVGDYLMKHSWKPRGEGRIPCLQPVEENIAFLRENPKTRKPEKNVTAVLIHAAYDNKSTYLEGCISPGTEKKPGRGMGILNSDAAMNEIFELLGKFGEGKTVILHVLNNAPGDSGMRETWDRVQTLSIRKQMGWGPR
jgi:uncharacterized protein DUF5675